MELFFRKYFWVIHLVFLFGAAFLLAKIINTYVGSVLAPKHDMALASAPVAAAPQKKSELSLEALAKLTGLPLPAPEAAVTDQPALPDISAQTPVKSSLRVRLLGTTVSFNRPEWSIASMEDLSSHSSMVYLIGDKVQNAEILEIERMRVIINNGGRKEYIDNEAGDSMPPPAMAAIGPVHGVSAPGSNLGAGIRAVGENNYELERGEIDKALSNLNELAMQARMVPAFKDGVSTGFKLLSIRPDSLYTKIGIQNGDVVRRINGFEINSPDKALEIYSKLKESSRIEIEIDRNGTPIRKTYNVR